MAAKKAPSFRTSIYDVPAVIKLYVQKESQGKVVINKIPSTSELHLMCVLCMRQATVAQTPHYLDFITQFCIEHQHQTRVRHQLAEEQQQSIRELRQMSAYLVGGPYGTDTGFGDSFRVHTSQPMVTFTEDQLRSIHKMSNCNVSVQARRKASGSLEGRACCQECKAEYYFDPTLVATNDGTAWSELGVFLDKHRHGGSANYVTGTKAEVRIHRKFRFDEK